MSSEVPFQNLVDAFLNTEQPLDPRYFYRLSDMDEDELAQLRTSWMDIPLWRRVAILEDIAEMSEKDTLLNFVAFCCEVIKDSDATVRLLAVQTLWDYEEIQTLPLFLDLLKNDDDTQVRAAAAGALGRFVYAGELDGIPKRKKVTIEDTLLSVEKSQDAPAVRRAALESLGYSSRKEISTLIESAFASDDREWKASALCAMGRSADNRWRPTILQALKNNLPVIRCEAARAAGELEIRSVVPILIDLLDDPDDNTRFASIWSLSQIGGAGVQPALQRILAQAVDEEEIEQIETALDNLAFFEGEQLLPILDLPDSNDPDDEWEIDLEVSDEIDEYPEDKEDDY